MTVSYNRILKMVNVRFTVAGERRDCSGGKRDSLDTVDYEGRVRM
jgi:hypothetical protein